jgi:hypothetical protein
MWGISLTAEIPVAFREELCFVELAKSWAEPRVGVCWGNAIPWRHVQQINLKQAVSRWNMLQGGGLGADHISCLTYNIETSCGNFSPACCTNLHTLNLWFLTTTLESQLWSPGNWRFENGYRIFITSSVCSAEDTTTKPNEGLFLKFGRNVWVIYVLNIIPQ